MYCSKKILHCYFIIIEQWIFALHKNSTYIYCCAYNTNVFAKGENYSLGLFNVLCLYCAKPILKGSYLQRFKTYTKGKDSFGSGDISRFEKCNHIRYKLSFWIINHL